MGSCIKLCSECHYCNNVFGSRLCAYLGILCEDRRFNCKSFSVKKQPVITRPEGRCLPAVSVCAGSPVNFLLKKVRR